MTDARTLVPLTQRMVDKCVKLAQPVDGAGDFTITLYIKRRGSEVEADAQISVRRPKKAKGGHP